MKQIKIVESNAAAIEAVLDEVNGRATAHTYTHFSDILELATNAEAKLERLKIKVKSRVGAILTSESGDSVPNCYKGSRKTTFVRIDRRSTGWFLSSVQSSSSYQEAGSTRLHLTQAQATDAMNGFQDRNFSILQASSVS